MQLNRRALVRAIPRSFAQALSQRDGPPPDPAQAAVEHAAYVNALQSHLGLSILALPADEAQPDCVFVEDNALVIDGLAIETRSAVPSRQGERAAVISALGAHLPTASLPPEALLDGGDVLVVGPHVYVGLSARTNAAAARALAALLPSRCVIPVELPHGLHLKCHATSPDGVHILLAEGTLPPRAFREPCWMAPAAEAEGANVLGHQGAVLVSASFPRVAELLDRHGLRVHALSTVQVARADGALTCCSILFP